MILNFQQFTESIKYDTYNGPPITTFSGDNRPLSTNASVAGGNGGNIGGAEFDANTGVPCSRGERPPISKGIEISKQKKKLDRIKKRKLALLKRMDTYQEKNKKD
jgi:hypothetical protein